MDLVIYGANWCKPCKLLKDKLNTLGVEFNYVEISQDYNPHNFRNIPVLCLEDSGIIKEKFVNPTIEQAKILIEKLG